MFSENSHTDPSLLPGETWEKGCQYQSNIGKASPTLHSLAQELLMSPGRFRSPLSFWEKIGLKVFIYSLKFDFFGLKKKFSFSDSGQVLPYNWQILVQYLIQQGVIERRSLVRSFANDRVKMKSFRFLLAIKGNRAQISTGNAFNTEVAISKAIGETLERFLCLSRIQVRIMRASYSVLRKAGKNFLAPADLSQFSSDQKEKEKGFSFSDQTSFAWIRGVEFFSGKNILLPLQSVSYGNQIITKGEPILREQNSNGAAGGFTLTEALLSGIYESVERDGFLIYWLNNIAPPIIDVSKVEDEELKEMMKMISRYQFEARFLNVTSDLGIPSCVCVLIDRTGTGPALSVGGGAGYDIVAVLCASLREAISVYSGPFENGIFLGSRGKYAPFSDRKIDMEKRIELWQTPGMFHHIEAFLAGPRVTVEEAFPNIPFFHDKNAELKHVKKIFQSFGKGYEIYYYNMKHKILQTLGYNVVKVIIPELVQMYLTESNASLGATRLKSVPPKLGYLVAKEWNPLPHPFP